ncbi:MAG TPA: hypothetical protein VD864_10830, partial [Nocardioides sp.]|nr:hypothetical protein [Nocardioides sp.]
MDTHDPDIHTPDTHAPDTHAPDTPASRDCAGHRWTWRSTIAGAVAGGVVAASVAVPVTWATLRGDEEDPAQQTTTSASGAGLAELPAAPSWDHLA